MVTRIQAATLPISINSGFRTTTLPPPPLLVQPVPCPYTINSGFSAFVHSVDLKAKFAAPAMMETADREMRRIRSPRMLIIVHLPDGLDFQRRSLVYGCGVPSRRSPLATRSVFPIAPFGQ